MMLRCHACGEDREDIHLGCLSYDILPTVTSFFRFCIEKSACKEVARVHAVHKLINNKLL